MKRHEPLHNDGPLRDYGVQYSRKTRRIPDWLCFVHLATAYANEMADRDTPLADVQVDLLIAFTEWLERKFRTCGGLEVSPDARPNKARPRTLR